jgi:DNA-binding response OmpR family regulator
MAAILIVEDDPLIARQMARTLSEAGHTPTLANDGRTALQVAAERPDIVLLDLGLPDLPGEEVLQHLRGRSETAHIPVLVITGQREAAARLARPEAGKAPEILLKPVSAAQLRRAVNVALESSRELEADDLRVIHERQVDLIKRILSQGSHRLAFQVCLLLAEYAWDRTATPEEALAWTEVSERASREGLVREEEASLLRRVPLSRPRIMQESRREGHAESAHRDPAASASGGDGPGPP